MVVSAGVAAVATIGSSVIGANAQSSAAQSAANEQQAATNQANATEQGFFNTAKQEQQPFINTGQSAATEIGNLEGLNGGTPSSIQSTLQGLPGYQFANQQGLKSVQNSATARGLGLSGASLKGAANYSTGLANQYYNNLLTGLQNTENTGENAASSVGQSAGTFGTSIGSNITAQGNANAASTISQGNTTANEANGISNGLITGALLQNIGGGNTASQSNYLINPTVANANYNGNNPQGVSLFNGADPTPVLNPFEGQ